MAEAGGWVAIGSLTAGEHLHSADGRSVEVKSVRHFEQAAPVYDLTVDSVHDYYVAAGAVGALSTPAAARPNVATKVTSADGQHVKFSCATDTRSGGMPSQTSRAVADAGHHGGCGEVGCAAALERDGIRLEGSTMSCLPAVPATDRRAWVTSEKIPPELRAALRGLRKVRSEKPEGGSGTEAFAAWRERMAEALESLAQVLLFPEDRQQAAAEAREARAEAAQIRARLRE